MGGEQSSVEKEKRLNINHPKFQNAVLIENNEIIKTTIPFNNESDYKRWEESLEKIKPHFD